MKKICVAILCFFIIACGAITREDIINQQIIVLDSETNERIASAVIKANNKIIGSSNTKGIVSHQLPNPNEEEKFTISVEHPNYQSISLEITAQPGGRYIAGGVVLLLLGIVPGAVSLGVDGGMGTWSSYDKKVEIIVNDSKD